MSSQSFELKDTVVRAGAGAGKTTALVSHVLESVESFYAIHKRWPRIVTTTFTRKATQELRERLLKRARELNKPELVHYVLAKTDLQVTTIHGVLYLLLAKHGHRIGLDPMLQLVDEKVLVKAAKSVMIKLASEDQEFSSLIRYISLQRLAELFVLISREKNLFPEISPLNQESHAFQTKAFIDFVVADVKNVSRKVLSSASSAKWKEFGEHLLHCAETFEQSQDIGSFLSALSERRKPAFKEDKPDLDKNIHDELEERRKRWKDLDPALTSKLHVSKYLEVHQSLGRVFELFHPLYQEKLQNSGAICISDLEGLALKLMREAPDAFHAFSESWDYWLIDEYQDTSPTQVELLKKLVGTRACYTVGDPQQSIYLFRGAQVGVFNDRQNSVQQNGGLVQILDKSWRSEPEYVEFMNQLFPRFGGGFNRMIPKEARELNPTVVATWAKTQTKEDEFSFICQKLHSLLSMGVKPKEIGILARKNVTLERLAQGLEAQGFPVQVVSSGGFFRRREILDLASILKTLINPHDSASLVEALRTPWLTTSDQVIAEWSLSRKKGESLWQALTRQDIGTHSIAVIRTAIARSESVGLMTAFEELAVLCGVIDFASDHDSSGQRESNIWKFILLLRSTFAKTGMLHAEILHKILETSDLDSGNQESQAVAAFEPDKTVLMTIHASKGLEFEHVIMPCIGARPSAIKERDLLLDDATWSIAFKDFESDESLKSPAWFLDSQKRRLAEAQEFERLFYVAITRAKKSVVVSDGGDITKGSWSSLLVDSWPEASPHCDSVAEFPSELRTWTNKSKESLSVVKPWTQQNYHDVQFKRQTVTALLSQSVHESSSQEAVQKNLLQRRIASSLKGTKIHRCLEALHYGGKSAYKELAKELLGDKSGEAQRALDFIVSAQHPPLERLIQHGSVEWGFHFKKNGQIIEGQIDLWGYEGNQLWVVDYKTGNSLQSEKAFEQLGIYAYALSLSEKRTENIHLCVVYPFERKLITREFSFSQVEKLLSR